MASDEGFLQAVLADPDDDVVRLVYADWLEEHGNPDRAEFIRVQIELARLDEDDLRRPYLEYRERTLEYDRFGEWPELASWPGVRIQRFVRGFVEEVSLPAARFPALAGELFAAAPIRAIRLHGLSGSMTALAACPALARLHGLDLSFGELPEADFGVLLQSPYLRSLQRLNVAGNRMRPHAIETLADSRSLENLLSLDLGGNQIGDDGAAALTAFPGLLSLESLRLWYAGGHYSGMIHTRGAMALAQSGMLNRLKLLDLNAQQIGDGGLRELASSEELSQLTHLELKDNGIGEIGDAGIEALALSPPLTNLRYLELSGNAIGVGGGRALAIWRGLARIRFLGLEECSLGDSGVRALAESVHAEGLRELKLGRNCLTERGARALLESPYLSPSLKLDLSGNGISLDMRDALADRFRITFFD